MGRELQKKKNKSSLPRRRQNPKSKKKILANPIIAANWNQKETLSQNYRRLGLTARLNHATGGTEKTIKLLGLDNPNTDPTIDTTVDKLNIVGHAPIESTGVDEAQVERDPETGAILRVINDPFALNDNPLNDPINEVMDEEKEEWNAFAMVPEGQTDNPVIRALEEAARNGVKKAPRKQSEREEEWIEKLVNKYGDDYGKMTRDRKLNPFQQSEGDIRRRAKKWQQSKVQAKA
ncbi:nucleolar protein 16 [Pleomassaria siparia CBS 279.74]|uniref:Nucleolar protein 16 n=1 Tax=Pleomassaria siparia CBS 279.74 TaxID=1314801 RepID=A0A6G1KAH3_9PLEO|nr:nucleolar protein 16 [Pleomassaria siparia CBS 279.74]